MDDHKKKMRSLKKRFFNISMSFIAVVVAAILIIKGDHNANTWLLICIIFLLGEIRDKLKNK